MTKLKSKIDVLILLFAIFIGFIFRIYGLNKNYSFWVDEASTARFGRGFLETGRHQISLTGYKEKSYFITHYLTGLFFKLFGTSEFSARLPEVIFGTLVILATYFLGKELFDKKVGLFSALFVCFSYIQIAWSRQARGYVILEFFSVVCLLFLYRFLIVGKIKYMLYSFLFLILSIATHNLGFILLPISFTVYLFQAFLKRNRHNFLLTFQTLIIFFTTGLIFYYFRNFVNFYFSFIVDKWLIGGNFVFYYHSLFWRHYPIFTLMLFLGLIILWIKKEKIKVFFLICVLFWYFFIVCFFSDVSFEKYILSVFPICFIISSFSLSEITKSLFKSKRNNLLFILVGFILVNGNKFTLKPRAFYSLNFDMKEIPEIDYKGIYQVVKEKTADINKQDLAIVEIDADAPAWYLGEGINGYVPRNDIPGPIDVSRGYRFVRSLDEFKKVQKEYRYGFINLIEHNFRFYPEGLVEYARSNLKLEKKEQYASFSPDWNHWPVELYSWGFSESGLNK